MRLIVTWIAAALLLGNMAQAEDRAASGAGGRLVVVELYTSQGCSSCPPADAFLAELAKRDDVVPLALHVDYWDYIGWKDEFAQPQFTKRQKAYARAAGRRSIYTPQMIVNGVEHVVGNHPKDVTYLIDRHGETASGPELLLRRQGDRLMISAPPMARPAPVWVQLVQFIPNRSIEIRSGENAGRTLNYANIVTSWTRVGDWTGQRPLDMTISVTEAGPLAVILQHPGPGPVVTAAMLR